ncbi:MAG: hypothetical protein JXR96_03365 [Deltaproteobacteria bacterium]|nr:hypothetical protein [Deltaproteobacteria bacterium]
MSRVLASLSIAAVLVALSASAHAQEAKIHHGFLFFASESYTMDEETYGIWEEGHHYEDQIKENAAALAAFNSYRTWHTTGIVFTGMSLASVVVGAVMYMPGVSKEVPEHIGAYIMAGGGGLLVMGIVFEFISWGKITDSARIYNSELMDEGPALDMDALPSPTLALTEGGAHLALTWRF